MTWRVDRKVHPHPRGWGLLDTRTIDALNVPHAAMGDGMKTVGSVAAILLGFMMWAQFASADDYFYVGNNISDPGNGHGRLRIVTTANVRPAYFQITSSEDAEDPGDEFGMRPAVSGVGIGTAETSVYGLFGMGIRENSNPWFVTGAEFTVWNKASMSVPTSPSGAAGIRVGAMGTYPSQVGVEVINNGNTFNYGFALWDNAADTAGIRLPGGSDAGRKIVWSGASTPQIYSDGTDIFFRKGATCIKINFSTLALNSVSC